MANLTFAVGAFFMSFCQQSILDYWFAVTVDSNFDLLFVTFCNCFKQSSRPLCCLFCKQGRDRPFCKTNHFWGPTRSERALGYNSPSPPAVKSLRSEFSVSVVNERPRYWAITTA